MKKLLLIAASLGAFLGVETPVKATATPGTQIAGATAVGLVALGTAIKKIGQSGAANTIGRLMALGIGGVAGYATNAAVKGLMTTKLCPACVAANPMVAPLLVGCTVGGLLLWLKNNYLPGPSKSVKEFGSTILELGQALCCAMVASYLINLAGSHFQSPFGRLISPSVPKASQVPQKI